MTAASALAPALEYSHARSLLDDYENASLAPSARNSAASEYYGARTLTYGLYALPLGLAAVTGGLTTWYFAASEERSIAVSFGPASASLRVAF